MSLIFLGTFQSKWVTELVSLQKIIKVTLYLKSMFRGILCPSDTASSLSCGHQNLYINLKFIELAITLHKKSWNEMNCRILLWPLNVSIWIHLLAHFWKLQVKGNSLICPQIWIVASLTYKPQNRDCKCFISKYFFSKNNSFFK